MLLSDGRVLLVLGYGEGKTVVFDPLTDSCSVTTPASHPGGYHCGGALLAGGRVLLGQNGDLVDCRIWDPGLGAAYGRDIALSGFSGTTGRE